MKSANSSAHPVQFKFSYITCRNITPPTSGKNGFKILTGFAPASSFSYIPDDENVRKYLLDQVGKQRSRTSNVHRSIRSTLENNSDQFPVLNSGIVILTAKAVVDDKNHVIDLKSGETKVSIINGSQTRGELKRYLERSCGDEEDPEPVAQFQIIVTEDKDLANEISIARNFQNQVAYLSILGKKAHLDELEKAIQKTFPSERLRKSETDDIGTNYLPTEKVLQVCFALLPDELFEGLGSKTSTYSSKAKWLKKFGELVENKSSPNPVPDKLRQYKCILDTAGQCWKLYLYWKKHDEYKKGFRTNRADGQSAVSTSRELNDGMIFPVIAAFSVFMSESNGKWSLNIPSEFSEDFESQLVEAARETYQESAKSNPPLMGKTAACYSAVNRVTKMYVQIMTMRK